MASSMQLQIPQPCHEQWQAMTPDAQGRFCASCSKVVIDFEQMSDQQIVDIMTKQKNNICGRFRVDQLNRPLQPAVTKSKKGWLWTISSLLSLMMTACNQMGTKKGYVVTKPVAQNNIMAEDYTTSSVASTHQFTKGEVMQVLETHVVGDVASIMMPDTVIETSCNKQMGAVVEVAKPTTTLQINFINSSGEALESVQLLLKQGNLQHIYTTDSVGHCAIQLQDMSAGVLFQLKASLVGYELLDTTIAWPTNDAAYCFILQAQKTQLPEVAVATMLHNTKRSITMMCGSTSNRSIQSWNSIGQAIKDTVLGASFMVYPNPATKGSWVHLQFKQQGDFFVRLHASNGALIQQQFIQINQSTAAVSYQMPHQLANGLYYLIAIHKKSSKQYQQSIAIL